MAYEDLLGKSITITIDRPIGSRHPRYPNLRYPVNYGYVDGILGGDGKAQDVYLLGVDTPVHTFRAVVIAVIHRYNDTETKWVAAPAGVTFTKEEIQKRTAFQERYFRTEIHC